MRWILAAEIAGLTILPGFAQAAWEQYNNQEYQFGVDFPAEPMMRAGV